MLQREPETLTGINFPRIEFAIEKRRSGREKKSFLCWNAEDAEEASLWTTTLAPLTPEPIHWVRIAELGRRVDLVGEFEIRPEETTAYYLVVKSARGVQGFRQVAEVAEWKEPSDEADVWQPQPAFLELMMEMPHVVTLQSRRERVVFGERAMEPGYLYTAQEWYAAPPAIWFSVSTAVPGVIFMDESFACSYSITNATCITNGEQRQGTQVVVDTSKIAGTKIDGGFWGAGATPPCVASATGQLVVKGSLWGALKFAAAWVTYWFECRNASGLSASRDVRVHVLSTPQFSGDAINQRRGAIRQAVKDIEQKLHTGCILNNPALDQSVPAFKNGHLNRTAFWHRLTAELLCIGNITFACKNVSDAQWGAGHWQEYKNEIVLEWSPKYTPNLEYVILHELVHKCGFNSELYKYGYSKAQIEQQAHDLSGSCYP